MDYTIDNLPPELYKQFLEYLNNNPRYRRLFKEQQEAKSQKEYMSSAVLTHHVMELKQKLFNNFIQRVKREGRKLDIKQISLPKETKEKIDILYITTFMACDIIESAALDMNDVLKKVDKSLSFETFSEMVKIIRVAKEKLSIFGKDSDCPAKSIWAEKCDNMYAMMQSKAKKIYNEGK